MSARRALALTAAALALVVAPACGKDDVGALRDDARDRYEQARDDIREARDRLRARVDEILGELERALPEAPSTDPAGRSRGNTDASSIDGFMTGVLESIDAYWTTTLQASDMPAPEVRYHWVSPGRYTVTGCGTTADDGAAFYCPADDTIYVAQVFASDLFHGVARGFPGERAGQDPAAGDFAVAYVLAHEYAHNVQYELGFFSGREREQVRPFELQADCMAGTWANSVYEQGLLEPGDLEEALSAALAVGDFEVGDPQHHGTPEERRDALFGGYRGGDPAQCSRYIA